MIPPSIALVFELCECGSLDAFLRAHSSCMTAAQRLLARELVNRRTLNPFPFFRLLMCLDCARALEYLHMFKEQGRGRNRAQAFRCADARACACKVT